MPVYWIWFAQLRGVSLWKKRQLLETFRDPEAIYRASTDSLPAELAKALQAKDLTEAKKILGKCDSQGICILTYGDGAYPTGLRNIEDPPLVLYYKGTLPNWQAQPVIGVVGTRQASSYGLQVAKRLGSQIAICGGLVVSGAASGIDAAAMEGALEAGYPTVGVLGCSVDMVYPAQNRNLFRNTLLKGCLLSQYPPGSRIYPSNFLQRNRIISGISQGVLVVEAPAQSGALSTARHALTQGRDLFAVPGNLGVATSMGSNILLQEGAYAVLNGWDVVKLYENLYPETVKNRLAERKKNNGAAHAKTEENQRMAEDDGKKSQPVAKIAIDNKEESTYSVINKRSVSLSDQENAVLELLSHTPQLTDSVMDASDLPSGTVQSILTRLAIKGLVQYYPDGRISKK